MGKAGTQAAGRQATAIPNSKKDVKTTVWDGEYLKPLSGILMRQRRNCLTVGMPVNCLKYTLSDALKSALAVFY
jgi:hypothetical protein